MILSSNMTEKAGEPQGFSSQKRAILLLLKRTPSPSLSEIADHLRVTKVAALRHLLMLEKEQLIERHQESHGVGRPTVHFRLRPEARKLFPEAYAEVTLSAFGLIEEKMGRSAVVEVLEKRTGDIVKRYGPRFSDKKLSERVRELTQLREEGGYMAESTRKGQRLFELCEHNCPIMAIAERYGEACENERHMFERLLRADVDVTHRVVAGAPVCRFLIRPWERQP